MGELVPVNPMMPVNVDSPRYAMDVWNRMTGERERWTPRASVGREEKETEGEGEGGRGDSEQERMAAVVVMEHPLFQERATVVREKEEKE